MAAVVTLRYAHALEQAVAAAKLDSGAALQQLKDFAGTLDESPALLEVLMDPSIPKEQKLRVLDAIAGRIGMFPQVRNFVAVVVDHLRLHQMSEILEEYSKVTDDDAGVAEADITSAHTLNDEDRAQLEEQVSKLAGSRVRTAYHQDASLLGGVIVRIGSTIYDGSVRGQLHQMKQKLINA